MISPDDFVVIAKIGKPFGVKGWMKIWSYTDPLAQFCHYTALFYRRYAGIWQSFNVAEQKEQGNGIIVRPEACHTPEEARHYTNALIAVQRQQLPELTEDEFYWVDLQGLTVINQKNIELGIIDHLLETASNDVLVVKGEKLYYIPYIRGDFVVDIDLQKQIMRVNWDVDF
ncbi:MAG: ribosome maturation factor RimM [Pseudomonadota bacterium]